MSVYKLWGVEWNLYSMILLAVECACDASWGVGWDNRIPYVHIDWIFPELLNLPTRKVLILD